MFGSALATSFSNNTRGCNEDIRYLGRIFWNFESFVFCVFFAGETIMQANTRRSLRTVGLKKLYTPLRFFGVLRTILYDEYEIRG